MNRMFPKVDNETRKLVRQINRQQNHLYRRAYRIDIAVGARTAWQLRCAVA